jgi:hypothetical protein
MTYKVFHKKGDIPSYEIQELVKYKFPIEGGRQWLGNLLVEEDYLEDDTFFDTLDAMYHNMPPMSEWLPNTLNTCSGIEMSLLETRYTTGNNTVVIVTPFI